jgi:hypothetical protein
MTLRRFSVVMIETDTVIVKSTKAPDSFLWPAFAICSFRTMVLKSFLILEVVLVLSP